MSWSPIIPVPAKTTGSIRTSAVSVGMQVKTRVTAPGLLVMLRPYLLPDAPAWLVAGETVKAMLGGGEHAGMIRLEPNGVFALGRTSSNAEGKPVLQLRLPLPPGIAAEKRKSAPVEYDYSDTWLEITLPARARGACPAAPAPAAPVGAPRLTGNATPPARGVALADAAAAIARRKAGLR